MKKFLSLLVLILMLITIIPSTAFGVPYIIIDNATAIYGAETFNGTKTVKLSEDLTITNPIMVTGPNNLKIDLNGNTLRVTDAATYKGIGFYVYPGATLEITNGNIEYISTKTDFEYSMLFWNQGKLKLDDVKVNYEITGNNTGAFNTYVFANWEESSELTIDNSNVDIKVTNGNKAVTGLMNIGKKAEITDSEIVLTATVTDSLSIYGVYNYLENETFNKTLNIKNSELTVNGLVAKTISGIFTESYDSTYMAGTTIENTKVSVMRPEEGITTRQTYGIRAKGNASVDVTDATISLDDKISTTTNICDFKTEKQSGISGTITVNSATVDDASVFDYLATKSSIKLSKNVCFTKPLTFKENTKTEIDLSGFDLMFENDSYTYTSSIFNIIKVEENAELKFYDGSVFSKATLTDEVTKYYYLISNFGNLTLEKTYLGIFCQNLNPNTKDVFVLNNYGKANIINNSCIISDYVGNIKGGAVFNVGPEMNIKDSSAGIMTEATGSIYGIYNYVDGVHYTTPDRYLSVENAEIILISYSNVNVTGIFTESYVPTTKAETRIKSSEIRIGRDLYNDHPEFSGKTDYVIRSNGNAIVYVDDVKEYIYDNTQNTKVGLSVATQSDVLGKIEVTSGTFYTDPTPYLVSGYVLRKTKDENGTDIYISEKYVEESAPIAAPAEKTVPTVFVGEHNEISIDLTNNLYNVNGSSSSAIAPMFIENGRTYLGVRDMANALGVDAMAIKWDDKTKTATISKSGAIIEVTKGSSEIKFTYGGYIYFVKSDASALIRNDRIYLPFRAIFQIFGYTVNWDATTRTITCK